MNSFVSAINFCLSHEPPWLSLAFLSKIGAVHVFFIELGFSPWKMTKI